MTHRLPPPQSNLTTVVTIPAKDEADTIEATLRAATRQTVDPTRYEILLLANNCADDTAARARAFKSAAPVRVIEREFSADLAHVGTARRLLMDVACERLHAVGRPHGLILTTDADTLVPTNWLTAFRRAFRPGIAAVAGYIAVDLRRVAPEIAHYQRQYERYEQLRNALAARWEPIAHEPASRHSTHTAANFAVRADAYRRVGGLPILWTGEDVAFYRRLLAHGLRVRHDPLVRVLTSGRLVGRVQDGLADGLKGWEQADGDYLVESPRILARYFAARGQMRRGEWEPEEMAAQLNVGGISAEYLTHNRHAPIDLLLHDLDTAARAQPLLLPTPFDAAVREMHGLLNPSRGRAYPYAFSNRSTRYVSRRVPVR